MTHIVRAFVFALTLTGASAFIHTPQTSGAQVLDSKPGYFPIPMCPPSDPNACGMGRR